MGRIWTRGTKVTVVTLAAALNNGANTYPGLSGLTLVTLDNSSLHWPHLKLALSVPDTFSAAPTAGSTIDVYMTELDFDSTVDETPVPAASDIIYLARPVAQFVLDNQDVALVKTLNLLNVMVGVEKAQFHLLNSSGVNMSYSSSPILLDAWLVQDDTD